MSQIVIEVQGGVVVGAWSDSDYDIVTIVDWDEIEAEHNVPPGGWGVLRRERKVGDIIPGGRWVIDERAVPHDVLG